MFREGNVKMKVQFQFEAQHARGASGPGRIQLPAAIFPPRASETQGALGEVPPSEVLSRFGVRVLCDIGRRRKNKTFEILFTEEWTDETGADRTRTDGMWTEGTWADGKCMDGTWADGA